VSFDLIVFLGIEQIGLQEEIVSSPYLADVVEQASYAQLLQAGIIISAATSDLGTEGSYPV